jgi:hypothetical protein
MEAMINQIVGRIHVGKSYRAVIYYVISRLKDGYKTFKAMPKSDRRVLMEIAIKRHSENRKVYCYVTGG